MQRQGRQCGGRRDRARADKTIRGQARQCRSRRDRRDSVEASETVRRKANRAEACVIVWRLARPCGGRRDRVEAGETVQREAGPCETE